ncbi:MAG TPA: hypothetical protein EYP62_03700 [Kiritimatiellae bacterium]|nr:hypothetical protein [Kiritimatiellia bacterium]
MRQAIRYLSWEVRLAVSPWIWLLPVLFAVLRLTGVIWNPGAIGWLIFLEVVFPLLFPLLAFSLLEREKNQRTLAVFAATPRRKAGVFLIRYLAVLIPLVLTVTAAVRPNAYLLLIAPGVLLGGTALFLGLLAGEEMGLGAALAWWGFSFVILQLGGQLFQHRIFSLFPLMLLGTPLAPQEIINRKWGHLAAGLVFLLLALLVAEYKRSWSSRS